MPYEELAFDLGDRVRLKHTDERGVIVGVAEYLHAADSFLVRYRASDGRQVEAWWREAALADVDSDDTLLALAVGSDDEWSYALGDFVTLDSSHEFGLVIGRAEYPDAEDGYLIRYVAADGSLVEQWWGESAISGTQRRRVPFIEWRVAA